MGHNLLMYASLFTITQFLCFSRTAANFCEWFICHPTEQYCCGYNTCCNYFNYTTLYLWGGAVLIGLLLVVLYYMFRSSHADRTNSESDKAPIIK